MEAVELRGDRVALRPASVPGEDRNTAKCAASPYTSAALRPASVPGEDRNYVGYEDQANGAESCARPPCRARIATRFSPRPEV